VSLAENKTTVRRVIDELMKGTRASSKRRSRPISPITRILISIRFH
jgi:hypothetical protein